MSYGTGVDPEPTDSLYSSRDLQDVAGLSPRQQNDWDSRGALPHERKAQDAWRRFTPRQVFVLTVCAEIRRKFGTPVERLKFVQDFMRQDGADHFGAACELIASLGVGVWLLTDFETTFIMDSELEFVDLWQHGFFGAANEGAFVLLNLNPLVNRVLSCLKEPFQLEAHGRGYEIMRDAHSVSRVRTAEEAMLLQKIHSGDFDRVEVEAPNGVIKTIRTTSRPDPAAKVEALLRDHPYQSVRLVTKEGRVVSITQEIITKPSKEGR